MSKIQEPVSSSEMRFLLEPEKAQNSYICCFFYFYFFHRKGNKPSAHSNAADMLAGKTLSLTKMTRLIILERRCFTPSPNMKNSCEFSWTILFNFKKSYFLILTKTIRQKSLAGQCNSSVPKVLVAKSDSLCSIAGPTHGGWRKQTSKACPLSPQMHDVACASSNR